MYAPQGSAWAGRRGGSAPPSWMAKKPIFAGCWPSMSRRPRSPRSPVWSGLPSTTSSTHGVCKEIHYQPHWLGDLSIFGPVTAGPRYIATTQASSTRIGCWDSRFPPAYAPTARPHRQEVWRLRQEESRACDTSRHALDSQLTHLDGIHNLHGVCLGLKG